MNPQRWPLSFGAGILAILIYLSFSAAALFHYPTSYSPQANWLSDLGNYNLNPSGAIYYEIGGILTGSVLIAFFVGYYKWYEGRSKGMKIVLVIAQVSGVVAAFSQVMSALFPENIAASHSFWSMMLTINFGDFLVFSAIALFTHPKFLRPIAYFLIATDVVDIYFSIFNNTPLFEWIDIGMFLGCVGLMVYNFRKSFWPRETIQRVQHTTQVSNAETV